MPSFLRQYAVTAARALSRRRRVMAFERVPAVLRAVLRVTVRQVPAAIHRVHEADPFRHAVILPAVSDYGIGPTRRVRYS